MCASPSVLPSQVGRQFVYSTFFAQLQRAAGPNYGKLAGVGNLLVASTALLQLGLVWATARVAGRWGVLEYAPANGVFALLTLGLLSQPLRCWREARTAPLV